MPSPTLDLFGDPLRLPTRRERQRVAPARKPPALRPARHPTRQQVLALLETLKRPPPAPPAPPSAPSAELPPAAAPSPLLALHPQLWSGHQLARQDAAPCQPSGFALLDAELPGGGWPTRAITELQAEAGLAWRLLAPSLAPLCAGGRRLLLIAPPHAPHPPGLAAWGLPASSCLWVQASSAGEAQWALEQALKADPDELAAVLAWLPGRGPAPAKLLRRAQTLAARCRAPIFVLQPPQNTARTSAAPLRLALRPGPHWTQLQVEILKRRGPPAPYPLWLYAPPPGLMAAVMPLRQPWWLLGSPSPAHPTAVPA